MRDGVRLSAILYRPRDPRGAVPAIFQMIPYSHDSSHSFGMALARAGFAYAAVDVRGRGNSGGTYRPWANDGRDGYDVSEWLARQPWCSGKVGVYGHSQTARAAWSIAKERPPHLAAILPISPGQPAFDWKNIVTPDVMQAFVMMDGATWNGRIGSDPDFWNPLFLELYERHLPLQDFDALVGLPSPLWKELFAHPTLDSYWTEMLPASEDFRRIDIPILSVTGQYDSHNQGALWYHDSVDALASTRTRSRSYLIVGPWDHEGTAAPRREFGGIRLAPECELDMTAITIDWFRFALKNGSPPGFFEGKRIALYEIGPEKWIHADDLREVSRADEALYLDSDGGASAGVNPGLLSSEKPRRAADDVYTVDPLDTSAARSFHGEIESWITDDSEIHLAGAPEATYAGAPLAEERDLIGSPRLTLFLSMDVRDADFEVRLDEMDAAGKPTLLGRDFSRARFRRSLEREELVEPGKVEAYDFFFPFVARRLRVGSRIRLVVRNPNSPLDAKNYGSGGAVGSETGRDARTARIHVWHSRGRESVLRLPWSAKIAGAS